MRGDVWCSGQQRQEATENNLLRTTANASIPTNVSMLCDREPSCGLTYVFSYQVPPMSLFFS